MAQALDGWREKYGSGILLRDGWLVGRAHGIVRLLGAILLVAGLLCLFGGPSSPAYRILSGLMALAGALLAGATTEVAIHLASGEVRTRRGVFFGLVRERRFVRPQIDGIFMAVAPSQHGGSATSTLGIQAGLERWAMYRTSDPAKAAGFYRELRQATGFPGV